MGTTYVEFGFPPAAPVFAEDHPCEGGNRTWEGLANAKPRVEDPEPRSHDTNVPPPKHNMFSRRLRYP